ncbi:MAG: aldehyde ferredoxin oxidoreductase family protein [Candidatus Helarchaeota archaeon]|nr:aldehyde ferredoxin oxidoreductase family protein [Candidatus Helarchaeota archaeon]
MSSSQLLGYVGKLLEVDLTEAKVSSQLITPQLEQFLGGTGFGTKLLYDLLPKGTDPLSPANILMFMTGPMTGSGSVMTGRHAAIAKSPLTGIFGYAMCGGFFGFQLKRAGYDGIILTGKAEKPIYIVIQDGLVEIRDASAFWGKGTHSMGKILDEEFKKTYYLGIGLAGENLVRIASIMDNDERAHGRTGLGAVMGSKNLKVIVAKGSGKIPTADPEAVKMFNQAAIEETKTNFMKKVLVDNYHKFGTSAMFGLSAIGYNLGIKNWQLRTWKEYTSISGQKLNKEFVTKNYHCYMCMIGCGRRVGDRKGPEYETLGALGSMCLNTNLESIIEMNKLCDDFGMDTIATGGILAYLMECSEKGLIDEKIEWGDSEMMTQLIKDIATKASELAVVLGQGTKKAAEHIPNSSDYAINVKGMEIPMHDPRGGMDLFYATASRGADHLQGVALTKFLGIPEFKLSMLTSNEKFCKISQDFNATLDSLCICKFGVVPQGPMTVTQILQQFKNVTGTDLSPEQLLEIGERIFNLQRLFNLREAKLTPEDDNLQPRFLEKNPTLAKEVRRYYRARKWDRDGVPKAETLKRLGLE